MSKIFTIKENCATNGEGIRTAIFISGCNLRCKGCFNYEAWDFNLGEEITEDLINNILDTIDKSYINGLTILGGEPLDIKNQKSVLEIIKQFRKRFGNTKTIWLYTGYVFKKNIPKTKYTKSIFKNINVLIDGPFNSDLADVRLEFRGSSNQRILRMRNKWKK